MFVFSIEIRNKEYEISVPFIQCHMEKVVSFVKISLVLKFT